MMLAPQLDRTSEDSVESAVSLDMPVQLRLMFEDQEIDARLCRVDKGFLKLCSPVALPHDARLEVAIEGCVVRAEVVSCEAESRGEFYVSVRRVYGPNGATRAEPRIPVDLSAVLRSGSCDRMFARVVDMSQSGLGFEVADAVPEGTRVSLHFAYGIAFGDVRHCTPQRSIYRAGMRIEEFVVRRVSGGYQEAGKGPMRQEPRPVKRTRIPSFAAFVRMVTCSIAGHEYGWFADLWERAVLRCKRCERVLSP
jgi:hypothetical protein